MKRIMGATNGTEGRDDPCRRQRRSSRNRDCVRLAVEHFPRDGSGLERYAARSAAVEINSTFHHSHKPGTFTRWAAAVAINFRFAVKLPRTISHELRLVGTGDLLRRFREETRNLGVNLGPLLLQLPPSLAYERAIAEPFFELLRGSTDHPVVCEPRHPIVCSQPMLSLARRPIRRVYRPPASPALPSFRLLPSSRRAPNVLLRL
jgi:uncharacterized protein YecE (DUF72 family)